MLASEMIDTEAMPGSFKEAILSRMDGILQGLGVLTFIGFLLMTYLSTKSMANERCLQALKESRNGVVVMSLCK